MAALGLLALVIGATLQTRVGWELPRDAFRVFTAAAGTSFFVWASLRPPAALARDDGKKVLFVLAGLLFVAAVLLWLSAIPE